MYYHEYLLFGLCLMDLLIIVLAAFIVTTLTTTVISSKIKDYSHKVSSKNEDQEKVNDYETFSTGYAYSIDAGDSVIIVVVMDKKNQYYSSFLSMQPLPIKIKGVEDAK